MLSLSHPVFQRGRVFFMSHPSFTPEERFAMIVEELRSLPDVTPPSDGPQPQKGFGASALKVQNKIFAMLVEGKLVVKLPKHRVEALIASGAGERFDPRHDGRLMKEWITVEPELEERWLHLAREAMEFVASQR
jgi:TfoX-like protein